MNGPENISTPRSFPEFSANSYRSLYQRMQTDADAVAVNVVTGNISFLEAVKPIATGDSYISWKMGQDPAITPWDRKIWGQVVAHGEPDSSIANRVVSSILEYSTQTHEGENMQERAAILRKLEADLMDEENHIWKINAATRQDAFYRLQFMREVMDRVTGADSSSPPLPEVVKARAVAQNLRYMQGELSQFLAAKRPSLKSAV